MITLPCGFVPKIVVRSANAAFSCAKVHYAGLFVFLTEVYLSFYVRRECRRQKHGWKWDTLWHLAVELR